MLDWEENLFVGLKAVYERVLVAPKRRERERVAARLKDLRGYLHVLLQLAAGRPSTIFESDERVLCRGDRVFLPREFAVARSADANAGLYALKAWLGGLAIGRGWGAGSRSLAEGVVGCATEYPGLRARIEEVERELPEGTTIWDVLGLPTPAAIEEGGRLGADGSGAVEAPQGKSEVGTELEGQGSAEVTVLPARDDDGDGADLPMHTFEKVETVEEYTGHSRKTDSEDELQEHAEGLAALKMTTVMRSAERPRSIYRCDVILDGMGLEVEAGAGVRGVPYPEWNHRRQEYRQNWCWIVEEPVREGPAGWSRAVESKHRRLIRQLRGQFASLVSEWVRRRRQPYGDEFDMDAVVDAEVERRTGHTPTESVYLQRTRDAHDIAALILMDHSYSTDAWLDDRRVLDVIRESVYCVGEVLHRDIRRLGVAAFCSNTRRSCEFRMVKGFREDWGVASDRLGALEPIGYTRIGPALRHAQELLERETAARKMILLLTDGRPCDYDRYEGIYGIKDVKKAIEVGLQHGIHTHAFAIEKQAAEFFPQMFARRDYDILPDPDRLARTMCRLFARLLAV